MRYLVSVEKDCFVLAGVAVVLTLGLVGRLSMTVRMIKAMGIQKSSC